MHTIYIDLYIYNKYTFAPGASKRACECDAPRYIYTQTVYIQRGHEHTRTGD